MPVSATITAYGLDLHCDVYASVPDHSWDHVVSGGTSVMPSSGGVPMTFTGAVDLPADGTITLVCAPVPGTPVAVDVAPHEGGVLRA